MSGTPTNPEATGHAVVIRDALDLLYTRNSANDTLTYYGATAALDALLTERDALQAALTDLLDYGDLRVMKADLADTRERLDAAVKERDADREEINRQAARARAAEARYTAAEEVARHQAAEIDDFGRDLEAAEATLTRYRNAAEQVRLSALGAAARETEARDTYADGVSAGLLHANTLIARAALDDPKEAE